MLTIWIVIYEINSLHLSICVHSYFFLWGLSFKAFPLKRKPATCTFGLWCLDLIGGWDIISLSGKKNLNFMPHVLLPPPPIGIEILDYTEVSLLSSARKSLNCQSMIVSILWNNKNKVDFVAGQCKIILNLVIVIM